MNSKGQVLPIFIIILPVVILLFAFIIDSGLLYVERRHFDNSLKDAVNYGMSHIDDENLNIDIENLLANNIENVYDIDISTGDNYIKISAKDKYEGLFMFLFENYNYELENSYYGYIKDSKLFISKE